VEMELCWALQPVAGQVSGLSPLSWRSPDLKHLVDDGSF
jgi:hypothetical protein